MIILYGIKNCDTVKRARAALDAAAKSYTFVDLKTVANDDTWRTRIAGWLKGHGHQRIINRSGTTWRKLTDAEKAAVDDDTTALALALRQPSVIKRPVVDWGNGVWTVGFDTAFEAQL